MATKAVISLQISRTANTAQEASDKNAAASKATITFLKSQAAVKNLQTTGLQLSPVTRYDNQKNQSVLVGYESRNDLQFETTIDEAGHMIDGAIQNGSNTLQSVTFGAEDAVLREAKLQAIENATKNAKEDAERAAKSLQITPTSIETIVVGQANQPISVNRSRMMVADAAFKSEAETTSVLPGNLLVSATVTVTLGW